MICALIQTAPVAGSEKLPESRDSTVSQASFKAGCFFRNAFTRFRFLLFEAPSGFPWLPEHRL